MPAALIGHTGFVGGNLASQTRFDEFFNSSNSEQMSGRSYDLVVCCGARAEKWLANQQPDADRAGIARLMDVLATVRARQLILVSTVDVFQSPVAVDETTPVVLDGLCPYGKHRFELEEFVGGRFPTLVARLPGLFGPGLKKNVIYDFLHDNNLNRIHHAAEFQFYDLRRLWRDLTIAREAGLSLVHLATEPVSVADVARAVLGREFCNAPPIAPARYDFRTRHAALFGREGHYLEERSEVLQRIHDFVAACRKRAA